MSNDFHHLMILRHDAVRVGRNLALSDAAIPANFGDVLAVAVYTDGEEKLWARYIAVGQGPEKHSILQALISRQPAFRLALLLDDLAEILLKAGHSDLRTREGALMVLEWVEKGCPPSFLPSNEILDEFVPRLRAVNLFKYPTFLPKSPTPDKFGPQLRALRRRRFGWVVPPVSGEKNCMYPNEEGKVEYPRVWLSEAQLEKYRANVDWPEIFA